MKPRDTEHKQRFCLRAGSLVLAVAVAVLGAAGLGHRLLAARMDAALSEYLRPKRPLCTLPLRVESWHGRDVPIDQLTQRIAGEDDFVNREYREATSGRLVSVYVGYIGRPRSQLSHRPDVCYPAHGYEEVSRKAMEVHLEGSVAAPIVLYEFAPVGRGGSPQMVLAANVINGRWVGSNGSLDDYNTRGPGLLWRQLAYVARIQVSLSSSGDRASDLALLSDFASRFMARVRSQLP